MRVAINGFGRIGRLAFRAAWERRLNLDVVAINDPAGAKTDALLLEFDSNYGPFPGSIRVGTGKLYVDGREIAVYRHRDWSLLPWGELGIDLVLECSGRGTRRVEAAKHLAAGARRVLISAPATGEDATLVLGVNEGEYDPDRHRVISNASCTTNALAPVAKVLRDTFGLTWGMMSTVHSYTNSQFIHDRSAENARESRAAALNIIPTDTGAAQAVGLVLPELAGCFEGISFRVPTPTVSVIDFVCEVGRDVSAETVNRAFRAAAAGPMRGILDVCDRPLVSMDFKGNPYSAIVDTLSTMVVNKRIVKVVAWYDNEWGYSCRLVDMAAYLLAREPAQYEPPAEAREAVVARPA